MFLSLCGAKREKTVLYLGKSGWKPLELTCYELGGVVHKFEWQLFASFSRANKGAKNTDFSMRRAG